MSIAVSTRKLTKIYRQLGGKSLQALDHLDLEVESGLIVGFIGPNGAGKSTTIKILTGLVRPTGGQASIFGHPCGSPEARRNLGYLPETANYHDFMSVRELLVIHATLCGLPRGEIAERCSRALERVGLSERSASRMRELSKGMKQRFGIAQALIADPSLLIFDEPTSGLDPLAQKEIKDIILELRESGATIFFSSHQLTEVELICDRIGIIHRGRLLRLASLSELLEVSGRTWVEFRGGDASLSAALKEKGWSVEDLPGRAGLEVASEELDAVIRCIQEQGGSLVSAGPRKLSLEDAFFQLIKGADS